MTALQSLPRVSDGWTFLYVKHAKIEREDHAIVLLSERGRVSVPVAMLSTLVLGPGTSVTHAAMVALAENGCSAVFAGEGAAKFYASGLGETRSATNLMAQARAWADPEMHRDVVERMYRIRFAEALAPDLTIEQVRGLEGVRVRETYQRLSRETGVTWKGRNYQRGSWQAADPINRAISAGSALLHGLCHAVIVATGFSPGLGFIHTGKSLAFVYDIADLYKCDVTVPLAFRLVAESPLDVESRVRRACREAFKESRLLATIVPDIRRVLGLAPEAAELLQQDDESLPLELWDDARGTASGGRNYGDESGTSEHD